MAKKECPHCKKETELKLTGKCEHCNKAVQFNWTDYKNWFADLSTMGKIGYVSFTVILVVVAMNIGGNIGSSSSTKSDSNSNSSSSENVNYTNQSPACYYCGKHFAGDGWIYTDHDYSAMQVPNDGSWPFIYCSKSHAIHSNL
jgi:hypothetical protein